MKGRYAGCHMTTYGHILPGAVRLATWSARVGNLTKKAKQRLKVLDWLANHQGNISLTARHFGLNRETVRIWQQRFKWKGLMGLNDLSHRPKRLRQPTTPWKMTWEAVKLKREYPTWSKYKIQALLQAKGIKMSASTIGRIFLRHNLIDRKTSHKRRRAAKHPRQRYPKGLKISSPGDLIQMDTKYIMLIGGRKYYQFTAIDVLTKKRILDVHSSESSSNGAKFLTRCLNDYPYPIKAIQTDNGFSFLKEFANLCQKKNITHYFIYPRHPKQNSYVEISHGADEREFYRQGNICEDINLMRQRIKKWESIWNNVRPHQALDYLTPNAYLNKWQQGRLPTKDTITLQT